jgi:hypothetical protein
MASPVKREAKHIEVSPEQQATTTSSRGQHEQQTEEAKKEEPGKTKYKTPIL